MGTTSWIQRAASLLLGCWLAVFAADPAALHVCPVHDAAAPMSHASHHGSMPHAAHHACTCPGSCCPAVGARLETSPTFVPARIVAFAEPELAIDSRGYTADVQLALPPSIGPPLVFG